MAVSRSCDKCTGFWRNHSVSVTTAKSSVAAAERTITRSDTGLQDWSETQYAQDMAVDRNIPMTEMRDQLQQGYQDEWWECDAVESS
jgi:Tfp pilus assembly protein PilX